MAARPGGYANATDAEASESGGWSPGPALQGLLALAIYVAVFFAWLGQALLGHLNVPQVGQNEVDPNFYIWAFRWWTYAVSHGVNPLYSYQLGAPGGYNLAWATTAPSLALLMWPVTAAFGAATSFNLTLLLAPVASAWAAFILARRLTGRFWAALPAGVIYGFNVFEMAHDVSGQPNITVTVLLPLMAYLVLRWWDGSLGRTGFIIWMAVAIALEFYTFVEAFAEMTAVLVVALVIGFAVAGRELRPKVARLAVATAISYVGGIVLASPYLIYALAHYPTSLTRPQPNFSLDFVGLVVPRTDRLYGLKSWLLPTAGHDLSSTTYIGIPLLVLLLLAAVFSWSTRVTRLLVISFVAIIALAAGPNLIVDGKQLLPLPWGAMWSLPIAKSAEPIRFIVFGYLVIALIVALWLASVSRSRLLLAARWGLAMLGIAAILADLPTFAEVVIPPPAAYKPEVPALPEQTQLPSFITAGLYRDYVTPGEIVVIVSHRGNAGMLFQASSDFYFRIAGGFINASLSRVDALPVPIALLSHPTRPREQDMINYVHQAGIGAIIVEHSWSEHWMYIFGKLGMTGTDIGGVTVFNTKTAQMPR